MFTKKFLILVPLFVFVLVHLAEAQVKDSTLKPIDSVVRKPIQAVRIDSVKKVDTAKKYVNPGKLAGKRAIYRSLIIPGWGQLYNNQLIDRDPNPSGGKTNHFWQKTYTYGKIGLIYTGFTLLTLSYIDNTNSYRIFLKEAQVRAADKSGAGRNPALTRYSDAGVLANKDVFKRNRQVIIFSYFAVYGINVIDAYVAARLHYFNIDDNLGFRITPTLINNSAGMYSFNPSPALKLSLVF